MSSQEVPLICAQRIIYAMIFGFILALLQPYTPDVLNLRILADIGADLFMRLIMMMVAPVVCVSMICGVANQGPVSHLGRMGLKTIGLYLITTLCGVCMALSFSSILYLGQGQSAMVSAPINRLSEALDFKAIITQMVPMNPIEALATASMLQIIVFSILLGLALTQSGEAGQRVLKGVNALNDVLMRLVHMIMQCAPLGVGCLIFRVVEASGLEVLNHLLSYSVVLIVVLILQVLLIYVPLLKWGAGRSPRVVLTQLSPALLCAGSFSSSTAALPMMLKTVQSRLGVSPAVARFSLPLGSTMNMDGTAIMQGVAVVLIANMYQIPLNSSDYCVVMLMATLASVGTAGVPGVGLMTLAMVLKQVGLPVEGIGFILGVDRILDMLRTMVNVTGDATIACVVDAQQGCLNQKGFKIKVKKNES